MKEIFKLIRIPFMLLPLISWTIIWPILYLLIFIIGIFKIIFGTCYYIIVLIFGFLGAALSDNTTFLKEYFDELKIFYSESFNNEISIEKIYTKIINWGNGTDNITSQIVFTNIIFLMLLYEETRTVLFFIIGAIITFFVWESSL